MSQNDKWSVPKREALSVQLSGGRILIRQEESVPDPQAPDDYLGDAEIALHPGDAKQLIVWLQEAINEIERDAPSAANEVRQAG